MSGPTPADAFAADFLKRAPGFVLRPARAEDAPFLRRLFIATHPMALPELLLDIQHRSQSQTYAALHPEAMHALVERPNAGEAEPIGRIMIDWDGAEGFHLVDIAILPDARSGAAGLHLVRAWIATADRFGAWATLQVRPNAPVIALYRRLGLAATGIDELPIRMKRPPVRRNSPPPGIQH